MKAYELLADPENWTRGMYHRFKHIAKEREYDPGEDLPDNIGTREDLFKNPTNYCHCTIGALRICYPNVTERMDILVQLENILEASNNPKSITAFNDTHTHKEILSLLQQANV